MKKILIATDVHFWLKGAGHRVRIDALIKYLAGISEVYVLFLQSILTEKDIEKLSSYNIKLLNHETCNTTVALKESEISEILLRCKFDFVIIEYIHNTFCLKYVNEEAVFILDTHDVVNKRGADFNKFSYQDEINISEEQELRLFHVYDYLIAICAPDKAYLENTFPPGQILLCPHPADVKHCVLRKQVKTIGFVASEYLPNIDGINHFLKECWPSFAEHDVDFRIYGNVGKHVDHRFLRKVKVCNYVSNLDEIYEEIDVVINPVRFGAGLKIKNIEAMSYGKPLITTIHGARGIEEGLNSSYIAVKNDVEFVNELKAITDNFELRLKLSINSKKFITDRFSPKSCFAPLKDLLFS